ncbi:MAG: hypothetical protein ACPL7I_09605, partial [Myxococcota bacterium]
KLNAGMVYIVKKKFKNFFVNWFGRELRENQKIFQSRRRIFRLYVNPFFFLFASNNCIPVFHFQSLSLFVL